MTTETIHEKPTRIRDRVLGVAFLSSVLLYLDRFCMNFAQRYVKEDLRISDGDLALCMFGFFFAYALAQVPSGWLTDRFGPRKMLAIYILTWSAFTALMGVVGGLTGLLAVRVLAGIGQAGAYPTCAAVVRRWVPFTSRGFANSIIAFGGRVGGGIAPLVTALLIVAFVPLQVSPVLTEQDILDPSGLAAPELEPDATATELERKRQRIAHDLVERYGLDPALSTTLLLERLNSAVQGDLLFPLDELQGLNLEREAQRLASTPRLESPQRARLNRLILEAVFPDSIRKIYVQGWRPVMIVYGLIGLPVALLFFWTVRDRPEEHPRVNKQEQRLISPDSSDAVPAVSVTSGLPLGRIVTSKVLWLLSISQFGTNIGWAFLVTWLPRYLLDVHHVPFETRGVMLSIPLWLGWLGMLSGGVLTDRLTGRIGIRWGRSLPLGVTRTCAALCFVVVAVAQPTAWVAVGLFALVAFLTDSGSASVWAVNQDVGGRYTASVLGWGNMWGNVGAAVSPLLVHRLVEDYGNWTAAFLACGAAFLTAGICGWMIDARETVSD